MGWQEEYQKRLVSAEEAVRVVRSGDLVVFSHGSEPPAIVSALAARRQELKDVTIFVIVPRRTLPWYEAGWEDSFTVQVGIVGPAVRKMYEEKRCDLIVPSIHFSHWVKPDVLVVDVSPPNQHGFCSFGAWLWNRRREVKGARVVIAVVNRNLIRTYGENYVHISEIDYFVEHESAGKPSGVLDLWGREVTEVPEEMQRIARNLRELIRDGDTVQIGVGSSTEALAELGTFEGKNDLGWHSETTPRGIVGLVREGVFTGNCKTLDRGKAVATMYGGLPKEELDYVHDNPQFELRPAEYVINVGNISALDRMTAINNAIAVDLSGQSTAESIGPVVKSAAGGQTAFAVGATMAKEGRSITVLRSTTKKDTLTNILPIFPAGTLVTLPRNVTDIVLTEWGAAHLRGKSQRQRVEELIAIAHPKFRDELLREARKLWWP